MDANFFIGIYDNTDTKFSEISYPPVNVILQGMFILAGLKNNTELLNTMAMILLPYRHIGNIVFSHSFLCAFLMCSMCLCGSIHIIKAVLSVPAKTLSPFSVN